MYKRQALTRAKYRCYMVWGRFRYAESSAIAYLLHSPGKTADSSFHEGLVEVMDTISDDAMIEKLQSIASEGGINLVLDPPVDALSCPPRRAGDGEQLKCRTMTKAIENDWRVTSFSSLIDGHASPPEAPDHDSSDEAGGVVADESGSENSIFSFPRGANPGTFLHSLFERIDFAADSPEKLRETVSELLESSTYDPKKYTEMVYRMVTHVLEAGLSDDLKLSSLQKGNWLQEMGFYFPLKAIEPKLLVDFFKRYGIKSPVDLERVAALLNFQSVKGMLLGFIDLVFCHGGRYYIVDWKSNHLGYQLENYTLENLSREMERKLYPLQYLLYTVALNRYLERRIPDYSYESHFGGVYYLFLRGIDNSRPGNGIYFDVPDAGLVRGLTKCLIDIEEG